MTTHHTVQERYAQKRTVQEENALAALAYAAVEQIPTVERGDRNRLGYFVWLFLRGEIAALEEAVKQARSRFKPKGRPLTEIIEEIETALAQQRTSAP